MRYIIVGLALAGCAAEGAGLEDTGAPIGSFAPEPPPGAMTETRYALDCATLDVPESTFFRHRLDLGTEPSHVVGATIPGFAFDAKAPPLAMAVHYRLSDAFVDWVHASGAEITQRGVESWDSELWFDTDGEVLVDCEYIAACKTFPCPPVEEMLDEDGVVYPEKLFGWMQDPIELIVWE